MFVLFFVLKEKIIFGRLGEFRFKLLVMIKIDFRVLRLKL